MPGLEIFGGGNSGGASIGAAGESGKALAADDASLQRLLSGAVRYAPPEQFEPETIVVPEGGGEYGSLAEPIASTKDVIFVLPPVLRGKIRWFGGRHVRMIGGFIEPLEQIGEYTIRGTGVSGSYFVEGLEFVMGASNSDVIDVCGDSTAKEQGFAPDIYLQNIRCTGINGASAIIHGDFFQPQGVIGHLYTDKITCSTNYDVYTIATDSCHDVAPKGAYFHRHNVWWDAPNATDPSTAPWWINSANGEAGKDTQPFPIVFDRCYADLTRGNGRPEMTIQGAIFPHGASQKSGGGNYRNTSKASIFANGEEIGAFNSTKKDFAEVRSPKMMVDGVLWAGSPPLTDADVIKDADGRGSFVPAGIGKNYVSRGYSRTTVGVA
jgi:hypothetical protein